MAYMIEKNLLKIIELENLKIYNSILNYDL